MRAEILLPPLALAVICQEAPCCERHLPAPFHGVDRSDVVRLLYPAADTSGRLGMADDRGRALAGALGEALSFRGEGEAMLAVLVETWPTDHRGLAADGDDATSGVDLALLALRDGSPALVAWLRHASEHGIRGNACLVAAEEGDGSIIGIRVSGRPSGRDALRLFRRAAGSFVLTFDGEAGEGAGHACRGAAHGPEP